MFRARWLLTDFEMKGLPDQAKILKRSQINPCLLYTSDAADE